MNAGITRVVAGTAVAITRGIDMPIPVNVAIGVMAESGAKAAEIATATGIVAETESAAETSRIVGHATVWSSVTGRLSSVTGRLSSVTGRLSSVTGRPSSVTGRPSSVTGRPSNATGTSNAIVISVIASTRTAGSPRVLKPAVIALREPREQKGAAAPPDRNRPALNGASAQRWADPE